MQICQHTKHELWVIVYLNFPYMAPKSSLCMGLMMRQKLKVKD